MEKIEKVLKFIVEKLRGVDYVLVGSVNLRIQEINLEPKDIDILTSVEGARKIEGLLKEYQKQEMRFEERNGLNSFRAIYEIDNIEVEVLGNLNSLARPKDFLDRKMVVDYKGIKIPCMPLEEELEAYRKMGREDKAKLIKNKLK